MHNRAPQQVPSCDGSRLRLVVSLADGGTFEPPAKAGFRVMDLIRVFGLPIKAECGGACMCSTCHVRISNRWRDRLSPPSDEELARLKVMPAADETSRLACQLVMSEDLDGVEMELQPDSLIPQTFWAAG